jgi:diguanylate cyclase (GGDEF)-like protein
MPAILPRLLAAASMVLVVLEERIASATYLAMHDELTGLPNRRLCEQRFSEAAARAASSSSGFSLLAIDLDRFKDVNDSMGHQAGDELLCVISSRLRSTLRRTDTVARVGGDEFVAIVYGVNNISDAARISTMLLDSILQPILLQGKPYSPMASIGVTIYPSDGNTFVELSAIADERMYQCKSQDRSRSTN